MEDTAGGRSRASANSTGTVICGLYGKFSVNRHQLPLRLILLTNNQAKTYSEAAKSPRKVKAKRVGLKIDAGPSDAGQLTLEAAFSAAQLLKEAKELKKKAVGETVVDLVS